MLVPPLGATFAKYYILTKIKVLLFYNGMQIQTTLTSVSSKYIYLDYDSLKQSRPLATEYITNIQFGGSSPFSGSNLLTTTWFYALY